MKCFQFVCKKAAECISFSYFTLRTYPQHSTGLNYINGPVRVKKRDSLLTLHEPTNWDGLTPQGDFYFYI